MTQTQKDEILRRAVPYRPKIDGVKYFAWGLGRSDEPPEYEKGQVPMEVRCKLTGTAKTARGCGGIWYNTRDEALDDLKRVLEFL